MWRARVAYCIVASVSVIHVLRCDWYRISQAACKLSVFLQPCDKLVRSELSSSLFLQRARALGDRVWTSHRAAAATSRPFLSLVLAETNGRAGLRRRAREPTLQHHPRCPSCRCTSHTLFCSAPLVQYLLSMHSFACLSVLAQQTAPSSTCAADGTWRFRAVMCARADTRCGGRVMVVHCEAREQSLLT